MRDLIQGMGRMTRTQATRQERQVWSTSQLKKLDKWHNKYWLLEGKRIGCCMCSAINKVPRMKFKCPECNMGLCDTPCLKACYTKLHIWEPTDTNLKKRSTQTLPLLLLNWYLSEEFSWRNNGDERGVDFTKGFMKEQRLVRRDSVFMFNFTTLRKMIHEFSNIHMGVSKWNYPS